METVEKTTEDVTQELNQLLADNNMVLDVSAVLNTNGVVFKVTVKKKEQLAEN